jgi:hypothetical protein
MYTSPGHMSIGPIIDRQIIIAKKNRKTTISEIKIATIIIFFFLQADFVLDDRLYYY